MKKRTLKAFALIGAVVLTVGSLTACGNKEVESTAPETEVQEDATQAEEATTTEDAAVTEETVDVSGTISMSGSTSMEKLANAIAESFMEKYPKVTVTPEFTGSSAGIEAVTAGSVDIGNSSRALKDSEKEAGAVENIVAIDGIAVVVDPANATAGLTKDQLIGIYKGEVRNWSEVGGNDSPIVVIGREAGSGTRGAFEEILEVVDECVYASELDSTGAVMAKVASTPGAIGYVSLDVINDTVVALALDSVEATAENIKAGSYFLSRPFVMATKGEIAEQNETVKALFDFLGSDEGREVISGVGLILPN